MCMFDDISRVCKCIKLCLMFALDLSQIIVGANAYKNNKTNTSLLSPCH